MRCRACIIKGVPIRNVTAVRDDPDVSGFISKAGGELGEKGRFVLRFSEIPEKSQVLVEAPREALCKKYLADFEKLLLRKGYMECRHEWEAIQETDYGEMDYNSYGGGVEHFVVTLYRCSRCGALDKKYRGDFCGDPDEYLELTDGDVAFAKRLDK